MGVLFQSGALLSGLTVQENVELPMAVHSDMPIETRHELASLKLLMVGLPLSAGWFRKPPSRRRMSSVISFTVCMAPSLLRAVRVQGRLQSR
jgi:ABC-type ATPase involved in cell division